MTADHARLRLGWLITPFAAALCLATALALLLVAATLAPWTTDGAHIAPPRAGPTVVPLATVASSRLAQTTIGRMPPAPVLFGLARLQYPPGAGGASRAGLGPLLLVVEAGALVVDPTDAGEIVRADGTRGGVAAEATLRPGDRLLLATASRFAVRNAGATPALVVEAGIFPVGTLPLSGAPTQLAADPASPLWADAWSPGATIQALAGGWLIAPPPGPATLTLSRLSLPPGGDVALPRTSGRALGVETGVLTLRLSDGLAWVQTGDGAGRSLDQMGAASAPANGALVQTDAAVLLPGNGALVQDATDITLGNDGAGPLLVLILTVGPAGDDATPSAA
jgi:hypothetical protein